MYLIYYYPISHFFVKYESERTFINIDYRNKKWLQLNICSIKNKI